MAINPDIRDQAYQFFTEEAPDLLQLIEAGLLSLNQDHSPATVHSLMRSAHSLKGGAAGVGLDAIATLAHRLENIFKALYNETLAADPVLEGWLLQAYDCLRLPLMEQIHTGQFDATQALAAADPILSQIEAYLGDALIQSESYIPSSTEMGVDMVRSIFEVDVAQGLAQIETALTQPIEDLIAELQMQTEVFIGFAEILNLPNFAAIAQTVQQALMLHPDQAPAIAQLALQEFLQSQQAVLAGDRVGGAAPSAVLLQYAAAELDFTIQSDWLDEAVDSVGQFSEPETEELVDCESDDPISSQVDSVIDQIELEIDIPLATFSDEVSTEIECSDTQDSEHSGLTESTLYDPDQSVVLQADDSTALPQPDEQYTEPETAQPVESFSPAVVVSRTFAPVKSANSTPAANLTVRVDSERLEQMNNLVGELAINRSSLALQNDQLQRVIRVLRNRFERFQRGVTQLQSLSDQIHRLDQILIAPASQETTPTETRPDPVQVRPTDPALIEFDVLEMDRYGTTHTQLQTLLEDLVQLEESVDDIALFARQSSQTLEQQQHRLTQLRDELIWSRMLPLSEVLNRFPRILRDLSVSHQKPVQLKLTGAEVLIDRAILEKLYDPLLHLLRNAFDHGIEPASIRQQAGKPEQGQIEIRAFHQGNQTVIEVRDDGGGIDLNRIHTRVQELNWLSSTQLAALSPAQLIEFIFEPGFSTAAQVSELSGRGFGLDVVRAQLQALRSSVHVTSTPGQGTTFTLTLPLTLTITQLIVCLVGSLPIALPADSIEDILIPQTDQIHESDTQHFLNWRDQQIPIDSFAEYLRYTCPIPEAVSSQILAAFPAPQEWRSPVVVLRHEQQPFGLVVDRILTEQELVIKPFGSAITAPSYLYGCTILGDGSPVPVVDAAALRDWALGQSATASMTDGLRLSELPLPVQAPTILVVDDAIMLRRTLALFLEREGFRVLQAQDGQEAIKQLQQSSVQLVVCDIEMPNMNGFEFLSARRQNAQLNAIPVIMLTSRSNDKHRWLALQLGATAYFTKPYLEQEFLTAIQTTLAEPQAHLQHHEQRQHHEQHQQLKPDQLAR